MSENAEKTKALEPAMSQIAKQFAVKMPPATGFTEAGGVFLLLYKSLFRLKNLHRCIGIPY